MLKKMTPGLAVELWIAVVAVGTALAALFGAIPTLPALATLFAISMAPAALLLAGWPGTLRLAAVKMSRRSTRRRPR